MVKIIENGKMEKKNEQDSGVLTVLQAIVTEQISTADDAMEDWADIVPDEVNELRRRLDSKTVGGPDDG